MASAQHDVGAGAAATVEHLIGERVERAVDLAHRESRPVLASAGTELEHGLDVSACVFASRRAEDRYFVWEQPDRDGFALGGIGATATVQAGGPQRFRQVASECAEVMRDAVVGEEASAAAEGPVWLGGFAFFNGGGETLKWATLPQALMTMPEVSLSRVGGRVLATVNVLCRPDDDAQALVTRALARLISLQHESIPMQDPDPLGGLEISSVLPPGRYEEAVGEARERIREGEIEKAVIAREVTVEAGVPFKPASVFDALRTGFPSCYCYCAGTADVAFVGASPELLLRREGARLSTVALAGSARRSADPAVDHHLGERLLHSAKDLHEHHIVVERIERTLNALSVWVTSADEPDLVKVANIQHLATPVRAQLADPLSVVELAGAMHPTPAVGGEPWDHARLVIKELESLDRGWYAAPVGWMDATEDGEFCVALRCALLEGRTAHCYAGCGVVADSDPEAELAETEVKLQALMAALAGV